MSNLIIRLEYDQDAERPSDWDLYSFNHHYARCMSPKKLGLGTKLEEDGLPRVYSRKLRTKLKNGLAHWLSYYEHGSCWWGRKDGPAPAGVEFRWDGRRVAGLLVWEHTPSALGAKTYEERCADADRFLATYTTWANGHALGYIIEDEQGELIDSCWGFYESDYMLGEIASQLIGHSFEVRGDAGYLERELRSLVKKAVVHAPV